MGKKLEARYKIMTKEFISSYKQEQISSDVIELFLGGKYKGFKHATKLTGGRISGVYRIDYDGDDRVIKYSKGLYRKMELVREAEVLKHLNGSGYADLVPVIRDCEVFDHFAYLVLDYFNGKTVREKLTESESIEERLNIWEKVGEALSKLHRVFKKDDHNHEWLNEQFRIALINMENNLIDLEDFEGKNPEEVLRWLKSNKPHSQQRSLLHGDFRTKNIMINKNEQVKVIDWGFVDIGNPYYDLAVIDYYFKDHLERESFYKGYKNIVYDKELIEYFDRLSWFINV